MANRLAYQRKHGTSIRHRNRTMKHSENMCATGCLKLHPCARGQHRRRAEIRQPIRNRRRYISTVPTTTEVVCVKYPVMTNRWLLGHQRQLRRHLCVDLTIDTRSERTSGREGQFLNASRKRRRSVRGNEVIRLCREQNYIIRAAIRKWSATDPFATVFRDQRKRSTSRRKGAAAAAGTVQPWPAAQALPRKPMNKSQAKSTSPFDRLIVRKGQKHGTRGTSKVWFLLQV